LSVTRNIVANFAGKTWAGALGLLVTPVYLRMLGAEAFGLIGIWTSLQALLSILDLGLSGTLGRELARLSGRNDGAAADEMRDLTATFAVVFAGIGIISGAAIYTLAGVIAGHWIRVEHLPPAAAARAVQLMGVVFAVQWPMGLLNGALMNLQYQGRANLINTTFGTLRAAGAILILWLVSSSIGAFFAWQAILTGLQLIANIVVLDRSLPATGRRGSFRVDLLRRNARLAAGITGAHATGVLLSQADKLVLSRALTLGEFGYYSLATTIAGALYPLIGPVFSACSPRLCQLVGEGMPAAVARFYHRSSQLMSVVVFPPALILALFATQVVWVWTGNRTAADAVSGALPLLAAATAIHGLMFSPWALQLACGSTRLTVIANVITAIVVLPLMWGATRLFGMAGAAAGWTISITAVAAGVLPRMHKQLLPGELRPWLLADVGLVLAVGLVISSAGRVFLPRGLTRGELLGYIVAVGVTTAAASALVAPEIRRWLRGKKWASWPARSRGKADDRTVES
jgi:O-antigen/teichoic acid export membrane protein